MNIYDGDTPISQTPYRNTKVTMDKSQAEIRAMLKRFDVNDVSHTIRADGLITMIFARPDEVGHMSVYKFQVRTLTPDDQGERQIMRMLYWWMKAKLETISFGIADFATEMLPYQLIAGEEGHQTVAEAVIPQLRAVGTHLDPFQPALPTDRSDQPALPSGH